MFNFFKSIVPKDKPIEPPPKFPNGTMVVLRGTGQRAVVVDSFPHGPKECTMYALDRKVDSDYMTMYYMQTPMGRFPAYPEIMIELDPRHYTKIAEVL